MTNTYYMIFDASGKYVEDVGSLRTAREMVKYVYVGGFYRKGH